MKLLLFGNIPTSWPQKLKQAAPGVDIVSTHIAQTALREIADADAFYGHISRDMLRAARRLRWIQTPLAGLESYFFPELIAHPVVVTNMRGIFYDTIPDHVMCFLLCFARDMPRYWAAKQQSVWLSREGTGAFHLSSRTLGIVGLGGIGYGVAKRAAGFGLRIIAVDARLDECPPEVEILWGPDRLADLLGQADIVAVCAPETPTTRGLFDAERFSQMKAGAYFINIGRGKVVLLDALVGAVRSGHLAGAALDVYEQEPLPSDHPLWGLENVLMTPHVAGVDDNDEDRRISVLADNLRRFIAGSTLHNVVEKGAGF
ncbi:MAG: D-2-hydroxyacid dehydrogenase [Dehalococcoidia bacterium]|nr:D-2-hydroxyacid dehydrogenase [Dehalococcoidia bacterium]